MSDPYSTSGPADNVAEVGKASLRNSQTLPSSRLYVLFAHFCQTLAGPPFFGIRDSRGFNGEIETSFATNRIILLALACGNYSAWPDVGDYFS